MPGLPAENPDAYVTAVVRRAGTSFYWGMRRLPADRRRALYAIYAFCREVDDVADGPLPLPEKAAALAGWRAEVENVYTGAPAHPIGRALKSAIAAFDLKREDFLAVVDGMEMDAAPAVRIRDLDELYLYCDQVASAVGRLCVRAFGLGEREGIALAKSLGLALQLTNILRDVAEDAERDRVYLPADLLDGAGVPTGDVRAMLVSPGLAGVCEGLAARAAGHFAEADALIAKADPAAVRPAVMMGEVYRDILTRLCARGWRDLHRDVGPSKLAKLWIAIRLGLAG